MPSCCSSCCFRDRRPNPFWRERLPPRAREAGTGQTTTPPKKNIQRKKMEIEIEETEEIAQKREVRQCAGASLMYILQAVVSACSMILKLARLASLLR